MTEYPKKGRKFELTLDGNAHDPLEMVREYGYRNADKWRYTGAKVNGVHTRRFKLISVEYCRNLEEVRRKLEGHGKIPGGQWIEAFKQAYPVPDGKGPVGVADPSWVRPDGCVSFPFVDSDGYSGFYWADSAFNGLWRWLVAL